MTSSGERWLALQRAAWLSVAVHLAAGLAMLLVLGEGLETNEDAAARLRFLVEGRAAWTAGWLAWHAAALSMLWFAVCFARASLDAVSEDRESGLPAFAVALIAAAIALDLGAQAIELGLAPALAAEVRAAEERGDKAARAESWTAYQRTHRAAMLLTGYAANGLYTLASLALAWSGRRRYPAWTGAAALLVGGSGMALSAAVLADHVAGMLWSNVVLLPGILLWQAGVAVAAGLFAREPQSRSQ